MNVLDFIQNNGQKTIANPNYNFKSKKNIQPSSITIPDIEADNDAAVNMAIVDFNNQYSIDSKENEKYRKYGLNYNLRENLDKDLANDNYGEKYNIFIEVLFGALCGDERKDDEIILFSRLQKEYRDGKKLIQFYSNFDKHAK